MPFSLLCSMLQKLWCWEEVCEVLLSVEMLVVSEVVKWVGGLVSSGTVVVTKGAVEAFSVYF